MFEETVSNAGKEVSTMKRTVMLLMVIAAVLIVLAPWLSQAEPASQKRPDYTAIKGGYYYPSERIRMDEFSGTDFDRRNGMNAEIGFGHYYVPVFGTEFGIGYFENRRFPGIGAGRTRLDAIPVLLSAKLYLPLGPVEPYAEAGIGAYFTRFEIESANGSDRSFREVDYGPHMGVGLNINFSDSFYVGFEGRYRRVKPEYDGLTVRLDGYTATMNLGFRY